MVILTVSDMAQDAINGWINKFLNGCLKWVIDVFLGKYNPTLNLCIAICHTLGRTLDELFWEEPE